MKLNRLMKLSEATKDVCDLVDEGTIPISIAYNIAFLAPEVQDSVAHLVDLGYKLSTENTNTLKTVAKAEVIDEQKIRDVLDGVYPPKPEIKQEAVPAHEPAADTPVPSPAAPEASFTPESPMQDGDKPELPVLDKSPEIPASDASAPLPSAAEAEKSLAGEQERPYVTKVILTGDRLRKYFPDVSMTPREIEESVYSALEERRQRQERMKQKSEMLKGKNLPER